MITKKSFKIPIFKYIVEVFIIDTIDEGKSIYDKFYDVDGMTLDHLDRAMTSIIILNKMPSIVAHECLHTKNCIFRYIGQKLDIDNDEVDAYTLEYLIEKVAEVIKLHNTTKVNN